MTLTRLSITRHYCAAVVLTLGIALPVNALAANEPYLWLDDCWGIRGEVPIVSVSPSPREGIKRIEIRRKKDKFSEPLEEASRKKTRCREALLVQRQGTAPYHKVVFTDILVSGFQARGGDESLTLNFGKIGDIPPGPDKGDKLTTKPTGPLKKPDRGGPVQLKAPGPPPDLLPLKGLTIGTTFIAWGQTGVVKSDDAESKLAGRCRFRYRYDTMNQGKGPAGATTNRAHLDSENGPVLAEAPLPALAPGAQNTSSGHLSFPVGTWMVYVHVDDPKLVAETDEKNNLQRVRVRVTGECK